MYVLYETGYDLKKKNASHCRIPHVFSLKNSRVVTFHKKSLHISWQLEKIIPISHFEISIIY